MAAAVLRDDTCTIHLVVNTRGEPESAEPRGCEPELVQVCLDAALAYRWYPLVENGVALRAQFDINYIFRNEPPEPTAVDRQFPLGSPEK